MRISDWSSDVCSSDLCRSLKTREIDDIDAAAPAVDQPVVLKCRVGDCNRRTLDAKNVGKLLLRQRQMRALVSARRGIEKNPAHAHFHSLDGGAGDELPSFNEQCFDVLVDGDAQPRWLVAQLAIIDGANTPAVPANRPQCPGTTP